jgi:hypothetical protein
MTKVLANNRKGKIYSLYPRQIDLGLASYCPFHNCRVGLGFRV